MVMTIAEPIQRGELTCLSVHRGQQPAVSDVAIEEEALSIAAQTKVGHQMEQIPSLQDILG